jgi:predicted amidohydrolase YtcJ
VAIHAIEQSSVEAAIIALEHNKNQFGLGKRHRIEHCSQCPPRLLERLRPLEAVIVTQPPFLYYSGERYLATLPAERLKWLYRIGAFHRGGLVVAGSSDSPIVPANPLVGMYAAVTRLDESGQQILPREGISPGEALAMYTIKGAYVSFEEAIKGSLAPGKLADMVVLSDDPLKSPPEQIKDIRVEMTIIGGEIAWEA